jgi:hypothetical protein
MSSINSNIQLVPHPAASTLHRRASIRVTAPSSAPPWTVTQQDAAVTRGLHPSAKFFHSAFLLKDMFDYVNMGYWLVLPYSSLQGHPLLCIAPAGVIPQLNR